MFELHTKYYFWIRSVSSSADIIFVESKSWSEQDIEKLSVGSHAPVVNLRSKMYAPGMALAECMSLQEHYEFLRRLTVSYIGPSNNPLLNTYPAIFPKLGIHFRYLIDGVRALVLSTDPTQASLLRWPASKRNFLRTLLG